MSRWAWVWLPVAFFVMCAGWAVTSPPGSSPDDDYHLASIWCAAGIADGRCEEVPGDPATRLVPARVVDAGECFAYDSTVSAACTAGIPDTMAVTDRVNDTAGLYPRLYYRTMAILVGPDVERSVVAMRLANAALAALLLALLVRTVPAGIRSAALLTVAVTFVPLGLFVVASTNPSGWSVMGLAMYWAFALALLHRRDWRNRRTWLIAAATVVTAAMVVGSRVDAAAYLVLATVVVAVLAGVHRLRAAWVSSAVVGVLAAWGALSYLTFGTPGGADGEPMGQAARGVGLLLTNLVYLPVLYQGAVGGWALGWNDTALPPLVAATGMLAIGALAYRGLAAMTPRKAVAAALAFATMVAVPLWFLQKEGLGVGEVVQPRYVLPLLALLLATLSLGPRVGRPLALPRIPALVMATGLSVSAILAAWVNAHRYSAGSGAGLFDRDVPIAWIGAPGVPLPLTMLVLSAATVVFVGGVYVLCSRANQGAVLVRE